MHNVHKFHNFLNMFLNLHVREPIQKSKKPDETNLIDEKKLKIKMLSTKLSKEKELLNSLRELQLGRASMFADRSIVSRNNIVIMCGHPDSMVVPIGLNFVWINIKLSFYFKRDASPDPYSESGLDVKWYPSCENDTISCKEYENIQHFDTNYIVAHTHYLLAKKIQAPYLKQMIRDSMPNVSDIETILRKKASNDVSFFARSQNIHDVGPQKRHASEYGETCVEITPTKDYYSFRVCFWIPPHRVCSDFPGVNICKDIPDESYFIEQVDEADTYLHKYAKKTSRVVFC